MSRRKILFVALAFAIVLGSGGYGYYRYSNRAPEVTYKTPYESDAYVRFGMEAYDKILTSYWNKANDADLSELFRLSIAKAASTTPESLVLASKDRNGTAALLAAQMSAVPEEARKDFVVQTVNVALYNLPPFGRSGLLSQTQVTDFRNIEKNIDPQKDLYQDIGAVKTDPPEVLAQKYAETKAKLEKESTPEAKAALEKAEYAALVLGSETRKARYDEAKVEPTVFSRVVGGKTLYIYVSSVSPTTLQEIGETLIAASSTPELTSLLLDLRHNIGGTLDFAKYFLGLFLGQNQFAFDLYSQDEFSVERTMLPKISELDRYKEIALLTDNMTQSTAETITAAFKRFKIGTVVGTVTRGWGTIENTFPMETVIYDKESYALLLVHSITLRDDNQPIEGRGVDPDIDVSDPKWQQKLSERIKLPELIRAVKEIASVPPER